MVKKLFIVTLVTFCLAMSVYAGIDKAIICDSGLEVPNVTDNKLEVTANFATSISCDTVDVGDTKDFQVLGKSTNIYSVQIAANVENTGMIWVGSGVVSGVRVSGDSVRINVDNLDDVYICGSNAGDSAVFIAELR